VSARTKSAELVFRTRRVRVTKMTTTKMMMLAAVDLLRCFATAGPISISYENYICRMGWVAEASRVRVKLGGCCVTLLADVKLVEMEKSGSELGVAYAIF
jgi:hypothetical protein